MQSTLFIWLSQRSRVMFLGMSVDPPKSDAGGIFSIVNQWIADALYAGVALMWFIPDRRIERALQGEA